VTLCKISTYLFRFQEHLEMLKPKQSNLEEIPMS
jgi:hypothetical protein